MILAKRANDIFEVLQLPDFLTWQFMVAATGLVVLIWAIVRVISRANEDVDPAVSDQEMLNSISELRREGDLTEDEYRSIKSQLVGRLSATFGHMAKIPQLPAKSDSNLMNHPRNLSQNRIVEKDHEASNPEESESVQPTTPSSLTEVPSPHQDTINKITKSAAPETETGDGN